MGFLDTEGFLKAINGDPEFRIAGRFWNAKIRVIVGAETLIIKIADGVVVDVSEPTGRNYMVDCREYDITISAATREWEQLFAPEPRPFYHDLFAAVSRHGFDWGGDVKMWFTYYAALRQMFALMGRFASLRQEA